MESGRIKSIAEAALVMDAIGGACSETNYIVHRPLSKASTPDGHRLGWFPSIYSMSYLMGSDTYTGETMSKIYQSSTCTSQDFKVHLGLVHTTEELVGKDTSFSSTSSLLGLSRNSTSLLCVHAVKDKISSFSNAVTYNTYNGMGSSIPLAQPSGLLLLISCYCVLSKSLVRDNLHFSVCYSVTNVLSPLRTLLLPKVRSRLIL